MTATDTRPDAREATIRLATLKALLDKVKGAYDAARLDALDALDPGDRKSAVLPSGANIGTVSYVHGKRNLHVNRAVFTDWVKATHPEAIYSIEAVRGPFENGLLPRLVEGESGEAVDPRTGEVVPGVSFSTGSPYVAAKQSEEQLAAFADAYLKGELGTTIAPALLLGWPLPHEDETGAFPVGDPS